jgi:hypothetical protein
MLGHRNDVVLVSGPKQPRAFVFLAAEHKW